MCGLNETSAGKWKRVAARGLVLAAVWFLTSHAAAAPVINYYASTGLLQLSDSGANYYSTLGGVEIFLTVSPFPSSSSLATLQGSDSANWTSGSALGAFSSTCGEISWTGNIGSVGNALPQGIYTLATLPTNLNASNFGYSYTARGQTHSQSPNNGNGSVLLEDIQTGVNSPMVVSVWRTVPSQNTWTGSVNSSWNNAGNWSLSHAASGAETASFITPSLAGTVTLDQNQSAGSLWFNSSNPYTISSGSGSYALTLSNTATIWIDAGLHTISAPLALASGGSLTVDAEPAGNVAPNSAGLTVSGQISGNSALIKLGPGILYLSNTNNSYNGNTSITAGTLSAAGPGSLGPSGTVTISNALLDFSGSGTFARTISLSGSGADTIQADVGVMTLSGAISGSGALTTTGNGTVAISNSNNSFSGGANVLTGTLQLQAAKAMSSTSAVTIASGALLDLDGVSPSLANLSGSGTVTNGKLSTTSTLNAAYVGGSASFAAAIQDGAGHVALAVPGGGLLTLSNTANTYSGGTTISSGGTLGISADANLGSGNVSINGGMLQATSGFTANAGRSFSLGGAASLDVASGQTLSIAGAIGGSGGLTKSDSGSLVLLGANTYQGGTVINGGTVSIANDTALGNSSGTVTINNGTLDVQGTASTSRPIVVNGTGNSTIQIDSGTYTVAGPIRGSGGLTIQGYGTLSTAGTISQNVVLNGGNLAIGTASVTGTLSLGNGLTITGTNSSLTFKLQNGGSSDAIDLSLGTGGFQFINSATATVNLTGVPLPDTGVDYFLITRDYSQAGGANSDISAARFSLNCPLGYSGVWGNQKNLGGGLYANYFVTLTGPTQWKAGSGSLTNGYNWTNNAPANPGGIALFGSLGSGTVSLPSGGYSLYGLIFSNTSSPYTLTSAGTDALTLTSGSNGSIYNPTGEVEVVSGSHHILAPLVLAANTSVTMYNPASSLSIAGAVSGTGSLTLAGSGSLVLEGTNSYSGGTIVTGAELYITNSQSLPPGAPLTVSAGGTVILDSSGVSAGPIVPSAGGMVAVPEPGTFALLAVGAALIACRASRRRKS